MFSASLMRAWRIVATRLTILLIVVAGFAAEGSASELTDTGDFAEVGAAVVKYAHKIDPARILLVLDIDNTLLAMNSPLGSDQWFEWQKFIIKNEPKSKQRVADSFEGLLEAQGLLYNLQHMHPPQPNLPGLVRKLQAMGIRTLVLTSRGSEYRQATERELKLNGYDFTKSALPVKEVPSGEFMPYDPEHPDQDGLTKDEIAKFHLGQPKPVSYEHGILMTAGQHKGAMLLTLLHDAREDVDAVVYDDDNIRHVANVYAALLARGIEVTAFHYTAEDVNVAKFDYSNKDDVTKKWRKLEQTLEEVLQ